MPEMELTHPRAKYIFKHFGEKITKRSKNIEATNLYIGAMIINDPTSQKMYAVWLARQFISGEIRYKNDFPKAGGRLTQFHNLKSSGFFKRNPEVSADINKYTLTTLSDFLDTINAEDMLSNAEKDRRLETQFFETRAASLVYENETSQVVRLFSHAAACYFGRNTRWCTAAKDDPHTFFDYKNEGALLVVLDKKSNRRWQISIPYSRYDSCDFFNERDEPIDVADYENETLKEFSKWLIKQRRFSHACLPIGIFLMAKPLDTNRRVISFWRCFDDISEFTKADVEFIKNKIGQLECINLNLYHMLHEDLFPENAKFSKEVIQLREKRKKETSLRLNQLRLSQQSFDDLRVTVDRNSFNDLYRYEMTNVGPTERTWIWHGLSQRR